MAGKRRVVYAFVDAANLFYGGERSLGWKIDYEKMQGYLRTKFGVSRIYYYAGIDTDGYRPKEDKEINLDYLIKSFSEKLKNKHLSEADIVLYGKYIQRAKFYRKLANFGYILRIKPTKVFVDAGRTTKKANCDVDLTFDLMRYMSQYTEAVILSGDGDFAPVLDYLGRKRKKIHILARAERTAKEIKQLAGGDFMDFGTIRDYIEFVEPKRKAPAKDAFHV